MAKNLIFSHNGYDPESDDVRNRKATFKGWYKNKEVSYREYTAMLSKLKRGWKNQSMLHIPPGQINGTEIYGSNFAQAEPFTDVFPPSATGVTFIECNLNNCNIPAGYTVGELCTNKHYAEQSDGRLWVVNASMEPLAPLDPPPLEELDISQDILDLPGSSMERQTAIITRRAEVIEEWRALL